MQTDRIIHRSGLNDNDTMCGVVYTLKAFKGSTQFKVAANGLPIESESILRIADIVATDKGAEYCHACAIAAIYFQVDTSGPTFPASRGIAKRCRDRDLERMNERADIDWQDREVRL